jgi:hypothetical protein
MIRQVQCARTPAGKLIEVENGPLAGWAVGDAVYATQFEASAAAGVLNQRAYIEDLTSEIGYGLSVMVDSASPFADWRAKYGDRERSADLVKDIIGELFPEWGTRSDGAARFAVAFCLANEAYEELHRAAQVQA